MRKLMAAVVGDRFAGEETFAHALIVQFGAGIRMRHRHLNCFGIEFLGEVDRLLDRFLAFPRQSDDEIAVDADAELLAVLDEGAGHLHRRALLDVLQDLIVARFETHDEQPAPASAIAFSVS